MAYLMITSWDWPKTMKENHQICRQCPSQESNLAPSECESEALLLSQLVQSVLSRTFLYITNINFSVQPFKLQVSDAEKALFNLHAHCRTVFSSAYERDEHLSEQHCHVHLLQVKRQSGLKVSLQITYTEIRVLMTDWLTD